MRESVTFHGEHFHYTDAVMEPKPVQKPVAALDRRGEQGRDSAHGAESGRGGSPASRAPTRWGRWIQNIKAALAEAGRTDYEPDHFGAGFAYHFGSWDDADVQAQIAGLKRRIPEIDPNKFFAIGDASDILQRVNEYRAAGGEQVHHASRGQRRRRDHAADAAAAR